MGSIVDGGYISKPRPAHLPQAPCKGQPKTHDCVSHSVSLRLAGVIWSPLVRTHQFQTHGVWRSVRHGNTKPGAFYTSSPKLLSAVALALSLQSSHQIQIFSTRTLCFGVREALETTCYFPEAVSEHAFQEEGVSACSAYKFLTQVFTFRCRRTGALHPSGCHTASTARRS